MIELESRTLSRPIPPQTNAIPSDYSSTPRSGGNRNRRRDEVSRPDGPNIEAQRVESGGAVLGEGQTSVRSRRFFFLGGGVEIWGISPREA